MSVRPATLRWAAALALLGSGLGCAQRVQMPMLPPPAPLPDPKAFQHPLERQDVGLAAVGTGRTYGEVARLLIVNEGHEPFALSIPAGTVLAVAKGDLQDFLECVAVAANLAPGERRWLAVVGVCLTPDRAPWPAGQVVDGVSLVPLKTWAAQPAPSGARAKTADQRRVAALAVTQGPFEAALHDPAYLRPQVPWSDDVVRQWTVWLTIAGKTKQDLSATLDREAPSLPPEQRAQRAEQVFAAAQVVVAVGGQQAAKAEGLDWAALDLTLK